MKGGGRVMRAAKATLAVTAVCSGLAWTAVSLTSESVDSKPPTRCSYTPTHGKKTVGVPTYDAAAAARPYTAKVVTNMGSVTFKALTHNAPCATNSFSFLAGKGYYDNSKCHRVSTRMIFVLQCGDPAGKGSADPGYFFGDENLDGAVYPAGTVALAPATRGRNSSQFFISYADPTMRMPANWTPFGKVVSGMDVLKAIAKNGTSDGSPNAMPKKPVVIKSVTVRQEAAAGPRQAG
ncbi:peptidylprolyl isomerase [Streptomyces sp. NPDC057445]|uniref:peptidylprolyl isomerase n=1 Tax=Streptomyces sp. NPDC057445 TaxID=3346136 RepID=UPI0036C8C416